MSKEKKLYTKICSGCGKEFTTTNHRVNFCQRPHPYTCENCGKEFTTPGPFRKTCSSKCRGELISKTSKKTWADPEARKRHSDRMKDPKLQEKRKKAYAATLKERYGDDIVNTGQLKSTQEKMAKTNMERYGASTPLGSKIVQEKIAKTNLEKYGVENPGGTAEVQAKIRATNKERYGVKWNAQLPEHKKINRDRQLNKPMTHEDEWVDFENFVAKNNEMTPYEMSEYFNIRYQSVRNHIIKHNLMNEVNGFYSYSKAEGQFKSFLDSLGLIEGIDYLPHCRSLVKNREIDFYFPSRKFGVEISPAYYHNDFYLNDKDYHYDKYVECEKIGVELYTIFEWHSFEKVSEMIQTKLGLTTQNRIRGSKCRVDIANKANKTDHKFLEDNHVLGDVRLSGVAGVVRLIYKDDLVGLGVFTKTKDENEVELKRLVFKRGIHIPGGASKIIKNFLRANNYTKLMTFSDNDLGSGHIYSAIGMNLVTKSRGQLTWFNIKYQWKVRDLSLVKQGADRLLAKFPGYTPVGMGDDLPGNREIIESYGFLPIYDCGYTKWETTKAENPSLFS